MCGYEFDPGQSKGQQDKQTERELKNLPSTSSLFTLKESGNLVKDLSKIQSTILGNLQDIYFIRQLLFYTSRHSSMRVAGQNNWPTLLHKGADRKWQPIVVR
jgi:hypothetical protein